MTSRRALGYLLPVTLLALVSGITPVFSGLVATLSREGIGILRALGSDRALIYTLRISSLWAMAGTLGVLLLAFPFAVTIHLRPRVLPAAVALLAVPWIVPVFISGPVWRLFFHGVAGESLWSLLSGSHVNMLTQPVKSFLVVLFVSVWHGLPPAVFILYAALRKVPRSSLEAAEMDGAGHWEIVRFLLLPQAREFVFVVAIVGFVQGFGEFTLPYVMTAGGPPLVTGITESYVVGATTTVEIYLYDLFAFSGDLRLPVVYSTATLLGFGLLAMAWTVARKRQAQTQWGNQGRSDSDSSGSGRHAVLALLSVGAILVFDRSVPGLAMAAVLLIAWGIRRTHSRVLAVISAAYIAYCVLLLSANGFLDGFQPAMVTLAPLALSGTTRLLRNKARGREAGVLRSLRVWRPGPFLWAIHQSIALLVVLASVVFFVYLLLWISLSGLDSALVDSFLPRFFSLSSFVRLLSSPAFYRSLANTLVLAVLSALVTIIATFPAAAFTALHTTRGRSVFLSLQFLRLSGGIHSLIPLFAVFLVVGMINTYVPLVLLYAFAAAPLGFAVFHNFIRDLPRSIYDEARMSGAGEFGFQRRILLPLCGPPAMTAGLLAFLTAWNGFLIPLVFLTDEAKFPLSVYLHNAVGSIASGTPAWGLFAAGSVLNVIVLSALFLVSRRPLVSTSAAQID